MSFLLTDLKPQGTGASVIGGYAVKKYGSIRATRDVDIALNMKGFSSPCPITSFCGQQQSRTEISGRKSWAKSPFPASSKLGREEFKSWTNADKEKNHAKALVNMRNRARRNAAYKLKLQIKFDPLGMAPHKTKKLKSTKWISLGKIQEVLASGVSYNVKFLNPGPRKKHTVGTIAKLSRRDLQRPPAQVNIEDPDGCFSVAIQDPIRAERGNQSSYQLAAFVRPNASQIAPRTPPSNIFLR
ncbi:hypothetical protein DFS34DRAFT_594409 [Phlyctochytrium arcticum]|nr:hypothetical protein DFS34DRAFT_594409 [Phlyctochytrium arcticum]